MPMEHVDSMCSTPFDYDIYDEKGRYRPAFPDFKFEKKDKNNNGNGDRNDNQNDESFKCSFDAFKFQGQIGKGSIGQVHRAVHIPTNQLVAIKIISRNLDEANQVFYQRARKEECIQHKTDHPNIVKHYCTFSVWAGGIAFVLEFIDGLDLKQWKEKEVKTEGDEIISDKSFCQVHHLYEYPFSLQKMTLQISQSLMYLHERGISFGDIRAKNIMIKKDAPYDAILVDFGLAQMVRPIYPIPQIQKLNLLDADKNHNPIVHFMTVDWYYLGMVLRELITGLPCVKFYLLDREKLCPLLLAKNDKNHVCDFISMLVDMELHKSKPDYRSLVQKTIGKISSHYWIQHNDSVDSADESIDSTISH